MGYAGGTTSDPTYDDIGDHTETLQVDYDPDKITYEELLDVFWKSHNPTAYPWSVQYRAVIFTADEGQRRAAEESAEKIRNEAKGKFFTAIEALTGFTLAEGYHQKYYLRQDYALLAEFKAMYPDLQGFVHSRAAAKVNGFLAGLGNEDDLKDILPLLGVSQEGEKRLLLRVR